MSIVTRFAGYFIKSRVINYSFDRIMTEMCKAGFQDPEEGFLERDPQTYYECRFYSHLARKWNPKLESFEVAQYQLAREKFTKFENLYSLLQDLHRLTWEYRSLYLELTKEIATHNTWFRSEYTTLTYEHHLEEAINKYIFILDQLKEYPLWQERVKEEMGYYLHLIYNSTTHSTQTKEIFAKFVFTQFYLRTNYISLSDGDSEDHDNNHKKYIYISYVKQFFPSIILFTIFMCNMFQKEAEQQTKLPILEFLQKKKNPSTRYILFSVQAVQVYKTHAKYKVDNYGQIWNMEIRYSTLLELYNKIIKNFAFRITFPQKMYLGNFDQHKLKKRAIEIQKFLNELSKNYKIINSDEFLQFLTNIENNGIRIVDYAEVDFQL